MENIYQHKIISMIQNNILFQHTDINLKPIELEDIEKLLNIITIDEINAGKIVFEQLTFGDSVFLVLKGAVVVYVVDKYFREVVIAEISENHFFGEMINIGKSEKIISVRAVTDCIVGIIYKKDFSTYYQQYPLLSKNILFGINQRLKDTSTNLIAQITKERNNLLEFNRQLKKQINKKIEELSINIIEAMIDGVSIYNEDGFIKYANKSFIKMYGYESLEELIGKHFLELFPAQALSKISKENKEYVKLFMSGNKEIEEIEAMSIKKDGNMFHSLMSISNLDKNFIVIKDITERKNLEAKLKEKQLELINISKLSTLGEMLTGLVHEINQPLIGVELTSKFFRNLHAKQRLTSEEVIDGLDDIDKSISRIVRIIKHVRNFARQDQFDFVQVDINETIESTLILLSEQLRQHQIEFMCELKPNLPKITGEPFQLEQVWINMITNARDALDKKANDLKLFTISTDYDKKFNTVNVSFQDNGIGMPENIIKKIFEPFFTTKEVGKGTGLGLSISHGIIQNHNGRIEVKSEVGTGTTFKIILPVTVI